MPHKIEICHVYTFPRIPEKVGENKNNKVRMNQFV